MSFILDALRKSDAERQRAVTPGLSDVRYAARRPRRNIWLPILVVVLAANAVFLAVQWGREPKPLESPAVAPPLDASEPTLVPTPAPTPAPDIRPLAREADPESLPDADVESEFGPETGPDGTQGPVPAPVVMETAELPVPGAPGANVPPASLPAAPPVPPEEPAKPSRIVKGDDLPTAEQLVGSGALNIPLLNLDLHVYSNAPAGRFVVINSRKYKEGGKLSEGPVVETITRDGVILSNEGRRFTLSRK